MTANTKNSFIKILSGIDQSSRNLALMKIASNKKGPVVFLTSGCHGDEVNGIIIIQKIFQYLQKQGLLKGKVYALPLMNPFGYETVSREINLSKEDLNRSFPGKEDGTLAERLAWQILKIIKNTKPDLVLDLHNDWQKSLPYVLLDPDPGRKYKSIYEKTIKYALASGLLVVNEKEKSLKQSEYKKSLSGSLLFNNIAALTFESGEPYLFYKKDVEYGIKAILNIIRSLGMIKIEEKFTHPNLPNKLFDKIVTYSNDPLAKNTGIIKVFVKPGELVKKDQLLAQVINVFGRVAETLKAKNNGIIIGITDYAVVLPGSAVISMGVISK